MKTLVEYIDNGIARLEKDAVDKSNENLTTIFEGWKAMAEKLEEENHTYSKALLDVKKHFSIMFQRDAAIMNKSTVYTIVSKALDKHSDDTK